jgi:SprT-like family
MDQADIVKLLATFGFTGLSLISHEGQASTYKYTNLNTRLLKGLGESTVTSNGKTAVYNLPGLASIGYHPGKSLVRFVYKGEGRKAVKNKTVEHEVVVTPELNKMFLQVQVNPGKALAYCTKLWEYFNEHKFGGRMQLPKLFVSPAPPYKTSGLKNARGVYFSRMEGEPGTLWMATKVFNATEQVFLTIFLHEMCHQATNQISRLTREQNKVAKGHGPVWQEWMVKVGLNPSQFDYTDEVEYGTSMDRAAKSAQRLTELGPLATPTSFKGKAKVTSPYENDTYVTFEYKGRVVRGLIRIKGISAKVEILSPSTKGNPKNSSVYTIVDEAPLADCLPLYHAD